LREEVTQLAQLMMSTQNRQNATPALLFFFHFFGIYVQIGLFSIFIANYLMKMDKKSVNALSWFFVQVLPIVKPQKKINIL
jgi:Mg2+/citrate symporter